MILFCTSVIIGAHREVVGGMVEVVLVVVDGMVEVALGVVDTGVGVALALSDCDEVPAGQV